jgi:hypothetical protein
LAFLPAIFANACVDVIRTNGEEAVNKSATENSAFKSTIKLRSSSMNTGLVESQNELDSMLMQGSGGWFRHNPAAFQNRKRR